MKKIIEYEDIKTPQELLRFMEENIVYGFISKDGKKYTDLDSKEYKDNWYNEAIVQTGREVLNTKIGTCFDQVELERLWFKEHGYKFKTIFIWFALPYINSYPTHSFLVYEENNKYYWFEHSFYTNKGIHEFDTLEELIEFVKSKLLDDVISRGIGSKEDYDLLNYYEYEEIPNSLSIEEYLNHVIKYEVKDEENN